MLTGIASPGKEMMAKYGVNIPGKVEVIWQPLYDYQVYPAAGALNFTFFQTPIGQGGNTLSDTNMLASGQVPKGQTFVITAVQVELYPSGDDIADPADLDVFLRDYYNVVTANARLELTIGSKPYLRQGPLIKFPPAQKIQAQASVGTGNAADVGISFAQGVGVPFEIVPLTLTSNQNFDVAINFDAVQAIANEGKIGVTLQGYLFRNAQ